MAAVATRNANNSPHLNRMSSPKDAKKVKTEDVSRDDAQPSSPSRLDTANPVQPPSSTTTGVDAKSTTAPANAESKPLGPPPKPSDGDYFSAAHGTNGGQYGAEPNPFEAQFGNPSSETPGKSLLPPVSSLTSPQPLLNGNTPGWPSLRSGPLSPAMLAGPTGAQDYFDPSFSRGFPTPNESGLRTGLTPGGGGSMFPAPSPNSQALFNSLQSGGATPSTLDFYRTSIGAKAASQSSNFNPTTSQPTDPQLQNTMDRPQQASQQDPFGQQHGDADAVNGLYMLAQASNGANGIRNNQFNVPNAQVQTSMSMQAGSSAAGASPPARRNTKNSVASNDTNEMSDVESEPDKRATRSRGKKAATAKSTAANNRRKAEDTPVKTPASKRSKGNSGAVQEMEEPDDDDEDMSPPAVDSNGKKMTDEEKRKNFLERNRVAALKCRQRKKQWLANLQAKVELFSTENDALSQTVTQLREELVNLKTLLLAHKDCPVSVQQGIAGPAMAMYLGADSASHHANPYGMGMQPNGLPQGMQIPMQQGGQGVSRG